MVLRQVSLADEVLSSSRYDPENQLTVSWCQVSRGSDACPIFTRCELTVVLDHL
jgi:hypothetical protein